MVLEQPFLVGASEQGKTNDCCHSIILIVCLGSVISQEPYSRKVCYYGYNASSFKMHLMIIKLNICLHRFYLNANTCYLQYEVDVRKFWNSIIKIIYRAYSICKYFKSSNVSVALKLSYRDSRNYSFPEIFWRTQKIWTQIPSSEECQRASHWGFHHEFSSQCNYENGSNKTVQYSEFSIRLNEK